MNYKCNYVISNIAGCYRTNLSLADFIFPESHLTYFTRNTNGIQLIPMLFLGYNEDCSLKENEIIGWLIK